ncbi:MAG: AAA family ATPase [Zavarzinella sp.]
MDLTPMGLRRKPFRSTPDTECYYASSSHENALAELNQFLLDSEPIALLTSEPGLGKTLAGYRLLENLPTGYRAVLLTNSHLRKRVDLYQAMLFDLAIPYHRLTEQEARLAWVESCLNYYQSGGQTLIVIDEAHHLSPDTLEELRLLSNLDGKESKAVQILLLGLPELLQTLQQPAFNHLRQRVVTKCHLEPLTEEESIDFLCHQVRVCGGKPERFFEEEVLEILVHCCKGVPRLLNQAAALATKLALLNDCITVDVEAALEAVNRLGLDQEPPASQVDTEPELYPIAEMVSHSEPPMAEDVLDDLPPKTIPFLPPVILPIDGPPTYSFSGSDEPDGPELIGPKRPGRVDLWGQSLDRYA